MNTLKAKQTIENFEVYSPALWRLNYLYICQKRLFHFLKILIKMNLHIEFVYIIVKSLPHMQREGEGYKIIYVSTFGTNLKWACQEIYTM